MNVRQRFLDLDEREKLIRELLEDFIKVQGASMNDDLKFGFVVGCRTAFYRLLNDSI